MVSVSVDLLENITKLLNQINDYSNYSFSKKIGERILNYTPSGYNLSKYVRIDLMTCRKKYSDSMEYEDMRICWLGYFKLFKEMANA